MEGGGISAVEKDPKIEFCYPLGVEQSNELGYFGSDEVVLQLGDPMLISHSQ